MNRPRDRRHARDHRRVALAVLLLIVLVLALGHCHAALPAEPLPQPERRPTQEEAHQATLGVIKLSQELQKDLNTANANSAQIAGHLGSVSDSLATATLELVAKQKEIDKLGAHAGSLELKAASLRSTIRLLAFTLAGLVALIGLYIFLRLQFPGVIR